MIIIDIQCTCKFSLLQLYLEESLMCNGSDDTEDLNDTLLLDFYSFYAQ